MTNRKWILRKLNKEMAEILADEFNIDELTAEILTARGHITPGEAAQYLSSEVELASPFDLLGMEDAVTVIQEAIADNEKIAVYGDYDCDGITATAILYIYLNSIGADVVCKVPERDSDGYGINKKVIEDFYNENVKLIITVDTGISAIEETVFAKGLGIKMVITDHHQPGEVLPDAEAVVDPHIDVYSESFKSICGVGVAFKLIAALEDGEYFSALDYFSDIVAIGTIGDAMPVKEENRAIIKYGLSALSNTDNCGLIALMKEAKIDMHNIDTNTVAFSIVPRLNAAGRMNRANLALQLLITEDEEEAKEIAFTLNQLNEDRKKTEAELIAQIENDIITNPTILNGRVILAKDDNWNHGVLGIACSRLTERYGKPTLLMTEGEDGVLTGSARSVGNFHMFKALAACSEVLLRYGGHKNAAGFSLNGDNYEDFKYLMEKYAYKFHDIMPVQIINIDAAVTLKDISVKKINALDVLKPFGRDNEEPIFLIKKVVIKQINELSGGKHIKLTVADGNNLIQGLMFGMSSNDLLLNIGDAVDIVATADIDNYAGKTSLMLKIKDIRRVGFNQTAFFNANAYYEKIRRGEYISKAILQRAIPSREDASYLYKYIREIGGRQGDIDRLYFAIDNKDLNYCKYRIILDMFKELRIINLSPLLDRITVLPVKTKVDLTSAPTYKKLEQMLKRK